MSLFNYLKAALILSLVELALASSKTRAIALGKTQDKRPVNDQSGSPTARRSPNRKDKTV